MIDCVIFDFDGTIADSSEGVFNCVKHALSHFGIEENNVDNLRRMIGPPLREGFRKFYGVDGEIATAKYREKYPIEGIYQCKLYDGMEQLLAELKQRGARLAIATSKPLDYTNKILKFLDIDKYFDVVVGATFDGTFDNKDDIVKEAIRQLGNVDIYHSYMVGDRYTDIIAGRKTGLITVGARYGFTAAYDFEWSCVECEVRNVEQLSNFLLNGVRPAF